nr:hypothetical protein ISGA_11160 [Gordonia sp. NB41Y]
MFVEGIDVGGHQRVAYVEAVAEYVHGVLTPEQNALHNRLYNVVGLSIVGGPDPDIVLTAGEARQLAAALNHFADVVTGIDRPAPRYR